MSKFEFKLPDIGEGVTEGEIVNWLVEDGEAVTENQDMVEVMTDKATVTIGAPKQGKVAERRFKVGDTVPVGEVLIVLELSADGAAQTAPAPKKAEAPADSGTTAVGDIRENLPGMSPPVAPPPPMAAGPASAAYYSERPLAAPATRKLARELGLDLRTIEPSGSAGRVTREDVEQAAAGRAPGPAPAAAEAPPPRPIVPAQAVSDERVPIRGMRKRIWENMARSKHTAAHFHYVDECDVGALMALRDRVKLHAERDQVKLTFLPFIIKAVVASLKRHPRLNAVVDEAAHELVLRKSYDIGVAVATEAGLMVPGLRQADQRSILDIAREIERLGMAARSGKIQKEDLGGSTFTVSSLGKLGGLLAPPIINYPEVGIMGVHAIKRRPVVKGDQIVIGDVMVLSFSFDHRIIDGDVGALFAQEIISYLQEPERLLLEMV